MPTASFQAFQEKVGQLATQLGPAQPAEGPSHSDLRAELEGFTVIYQRDDKTRTLTVEDILPASPKPPNS